MPKPPEKPQTPEQKPPQEVSSPKAAEAPPSFLLSPESLKQKKLKWTEQGYTEQEIKELEKIYTRKHEITDELKKMAEKGDKYWQENPEERKKSNEIAENLYKEALELAKDYQKITKALKERKGIEEIPESLRETIKQTKETLENFLNQRFQDLDSDYRFTIKTPEVPKNLTEAHLESLNELFGKNNLEPMILPTIEDLHNLDEEYLRVMYPENQRQEDKDRGLISHRPSWWGDSAKDVTGEKETFGKAYQRSMIQELKDIGGTFILAESIQKPNYIDGSQYYGTIEGADEDKDPLLKTFQEALGEEKNRFNHSHDELAESLLPKLKEKIQEKFKEKSIEIPNFNVILLPAALSNIQMTLYHPENSNTNTWEWTSTILRKSNNEDSGRRLDVGGSERGGASHVGHGRRGSRWDDRGARLAVVFPEGA